MPPVESQRTGHPDLDLRAESMKGAFPESESRQEAADVSSVHFRIDRPPLSHSRTPV